MTHADLDALDDFLEKKFKQMLKDGWIGEILPDYFKEVILPTLP